MSLLQRIANNDQTAVKECIDTYGPAVWAMTQRWIHDRSEAEDAVQEVFMALWAASGSFDPDKAAEGTFVRMVARRRLIDRIRRSEAEPDYDPSADMLSVEDGEASPEATTEVSIVRKVIQQLLSPQREVLILSVVAGLSHSNIAKKLDLPLGTVKTHIKRGLERIREELGLAGDGSQL